MHALYVVSARDISVCCYYLMLFILVLTSLNPRLVQCEEQCLHHLFDAFTLGKLIYLIHSYGSFFFFCRDRFVYR
jgi:hypothetical protein